MQHWQASECGCCRVTSLKLRVVSVAVATKHTAILTDSGAIYSWGANDQGQLGYGTSDSASNAVPRQVEAMKVPALDLCTTCLAALEIGDAFALPVRKP